ncbi:MAG: hypothetical protein ACR2MO_17795 [Acidimicrobiales bacterium]
MTMDASADAAVDEVPLGHLEHEICQLSTHLSAAICRWLDLVAEFDRRQGWGHQGAKSCAERLSRRYGLSLVSAREHLRVALHLAELPVVRGLRRWRAHPLEGSGAGAHRKAGTGAPLVELARYTTAAQLDRMARARSSVRTGDEAATPRAAIRPATSTGSGMRTARWCSPPDLTHEGALVLRALDAGDHALRNQRRDDPASSRVNLSTEFDDAAASSEPAEAPAKGSVAAARRGNAEAARIPFTRADALVAMAETMLGQGPTARDGGERYQVVVTVAHDTQAGVADGVGKIDDGPWPARAAPRAARPQRRGSRCPR